MGTPIIDPTLRFWPRVTGGDFETCWLWTGGLTGSGYGLFWLDGRNQVAHRVAYEELVGPIPDELQADHLCRNRRCVNPWHIDLVPVGVNVLRGDGPAARNARKTHCFRGHAFDEANTNINPSGGRRCRACGRHNAKVAYRKARAA